MTCTRHKRRHVPSSWADRCKSYKCSAYITSPGWEAHAHSWGTVMAIPPAWHPCLDPISSRPTHSPLTSRSTWLLAANTQHSHTHRSPLNTRTDPAHLPIPTQIWAPYLLAGPAWSFHSISYTYPAWGRHKHAHHPKQDIWFMACSPTIANVVESINCLILPGSSSALSWFWLG